MPRMKENPRYNVVSTRVDDATWDMIQAACGQDSVATFLHAAIEEKLIAERQERIDAVTRSPR